LITSFSFFEGVALPVRDLATSSTQSPSTSISSDEARFLPLAIFSKLPAGCAAQRPAAKYLSGVCVVPSMRSLNILFAASRK